MSLSIKGGSERPAVRFDKPEQLLLSADIRSALAGNLAAADQRSGLDVCAVIDRSGSMFGELELVKETLAFMISKLSDVDQCSIVAFGSKVSVELQMTHMSDTGKRFATEVASKIQIEGSTYLSGGLFEGIEQLAKSKETLDSTRTRALLLFTDGEPNKGVTLEGELVTRTRELLSKHNLLKSTSIFTFGYGSDHRATLLSAIADAFKGMYYYVQNRDAIKSAFANCLGGLLTVVAKDVLLELRPAKGIHVVKIMTKYDHKFIDAAKCWQVSIGDVYQEEQRNIPFEVQLPQLPAAEAAAQPIVHLTLRFVDVANRANLTKEAEIFVARPCESEVPKDATPQSAELDEHRNRILVAEALEAAAKKGNVGDLKQAKQLLQQAVDKLDVSISAQSPFTQSLVRDLKLAIASMNSADEYRHVGSKYMYSLSRSLYAQRSAGLSTGASATFSTSSQRYMVDLATGKSTAESSSSSASAATAPTNSKRKATVAVVAPAAAAAAPAMPGLQPPQKPVVSREQISKSVRRLMHDWKEIQASPLQTIIAEPTERDVFEWHVNMTGPAGSPYEQVVFHLIMQFAGDYPKSAPTLYFCSHIEHPHVFSSYVCLDMLQEGQFADDVDNAKPYTGWSASYSVQSILLQLQSFLFDEAVTNDQAVQKAVVSASRFTCAGCIHTAKKPWPVLPTAALVKNAEKTNALAPAKPSTLIQACIKGSSKRLQRMSPLSQPRPVRITPPKPASPAPAAPVLPKPAVIQAKPTVGPAPPRKTTEELPWHVVIDKSTKQRLSRQYIAPSKWEHIVASKASSSATATPVIKPLPAPMNLQSTIKVMEKAFAVAERQNLEAQKLAKAAELARQKAQAAAVVLSPADVKRKTKNYLKNVRRSKHRQAEKQVSNTVGGILANVSNSTPNPLLAAVAVNVTKTSQAGATTASKPVAKPTSPISQSTALAKMSGASSLAITDSTQLTGLDCSLFSFLSDELLLHILRYTTLPELNQVAQVCRDFLRISSDKKLWRALFVQRYQVAVANGHVANATAVAQFRNYSMQDWKALFKQENAIAQHGLLCYYSKKSFRDDIMGIPIIVKRKAQFDELTSPLDLLSHESFESGVRLSAWNLSFSHFLPVWINMEHGMRAFPLIERSIHSLCFRNNAVYSPEMALTILPRLMNSMVVQLMAGNMHASLKALDGYCWLHRLLIAFVQRYPALLRKVNRTALGFLRYPNERTKEAIPSLGEFLPLLTVSTEVSWRDIGIAYLSENFDRHVLWAVKQYPELARVTSQQMQHGHVDQNRIKKTFSANIVSLRLLAFHARFFQIAKPNDLTLDEVAHNYDAFFGMQSAQVREQLQQNIFDVLKMDNWSTFFQAIGMKPLADYALSSWLVKSVQNSARKGYHRG